MRTPVLAAYDMVTAALSGLITRRDARRLSLQGDFANRLDERRGITTLPRPKGRLVWVHAVSVGESMTALPLITRLTEAPDIHVVLTTTTGSAASIVAPRLPERAWHQFAPLDLAAPTRRFLDHWQPDLALFVESEIWPRQIRQLDQRGIPTALINARLSEKSLARWSWLPQTARALLSPLAGIWAQSIAQAEALGTLSGHPERVHLSGNLKAAAAALPSDAPDKPALRAALAGRPVWLAASTHPGEEQIALEAHRALLNSHPDALLILAPRHVDRAPEILIAADGLRVATRSKGDLPDSGDQVYLADTMGEMGLWYDLVKPVFLGGSLVPIGGHNPLEPASFSCAVLSGPNVTSVAPTMHDMARKDALQFVGVDSLAPAIDALWRDAKLCATTGAAARAYALLLSNRAHGVLEDIMSLLPEERP